MNGSCGESELRDREPQASRASGRSGVDIAGYSRIEQGHSSPKADALIRIADAIGVPLVELVG
ncbi:helix-turn-helix domain-containing protein [Streptomyces avermitilis]|uniref:helix-turn-helix domain-containing protein n=1 Tax=Streptomyces avermitilis TaxID=33903 RepID=UPI0033A1D1CC